MSKIDFKKEHKHLYNPSMRDAAVVDVPPMNVLMVDGRGDPNMPGEYTEATAALFAVSYTIKFLLKKGAAAIDYGVMPLEGLWWTDDMSAASFANKEMWRWTSMIMQPAPVTPAIVEDALTQVAAKKKLAALPKLRFDCFYEGLAAQVMHLGPYAAEAPTIERLHRFIQEQGYTFVGKHHEIYLSDPRKSLTERMKTVIRQPIRQQ